MPLDHYCPKTTNNFEKLLKQKDAKNNSKMAIPILLTIGMHIELIKLWKVGLLKAEYDSEAKLYEKCSNANWSNNGEIEGVIAAKNIKDNDEEDPQEKKR